MTTFSRLYLNPQKRSARKLLTNPQAMHAAVRAAFPPDLREDEGRVLWRVDTDEHATTLYVVAPEAPDLEHLVDQAGWFTRAGETIDYAPLLASLTRGQEWNFALIANPVHSEARPDAARGIIRPHVTVQQQTDWLMSRGENNGFRILRAGDEHEGEPQLAVTGRVDLSFPRRSTDGKVRNVSLRTARFEGALQVTDPALLRHTLVSGLGRARAYGCGLMTLAKIRG